MSNPFDTKGGHTARGLLPRGREPSCLPSPSPVRAPLGHGLTRSPEEGRLTASEAGKELISVLTFLMGMRYYVDLYFPDVAVGVRHANLDKQSTPPTEDSLKISFLFIFRIEIIASPMPNNT